MHLVQILLPLYDNAGHSFPHSEYHRVRDELTEQFGGVTSFLRSPAEGVWRETPSLTVRDDIVIYEVMTERLDRPWWHAYRLKLSARFRQDMLIVRVSEIQLL
ncbi:hypothetical protein [Geobacter sp. DSM 9736]|uniref:hypothetical protein n=1 Tax=Geobacter sp. DSM 9736 TaxID=1277350 RepID=UPI000B509C5D|nr:hypothetical protein [Geobacter sp. DSM 9736]SNB45670.1 hypothetical protein SAMN06269301_1095 [Geobacter sp. DSM 9736]